MQGFESHIDGYYDAADQMSAHLRRRAERCFRARDAERESLKTVEDFERYRMRMHSKLMRSIGGLPETRTPLNSRVSGTLDCGEFHIEKVLYYSLPGFPVTASLYMPRSRFGRAPGPAILFVCGHTLEGKANEKYQQVCIDLALDGFVVLAIDPPGQGERMQFIDEKTGRQRVCWGTNEHTYCGIPYYASGLSIARYFIWDGIRGIDYLLTRSEVDPARIGVTGNSGGGMQTCYLMISDPRIAAAMPCTFVMDYESYLKTGQPQDAEQNLFGSFAEGPDHDDFITAMAPKPVQLGLAAYDFFPIEGALATLERARKIYALYGAKAVDNLTHTVSPTTHSYSEHLRRAAVQFFSSALRKRPAPKGVGFETPQPLNPQLLNVTPSGQVVTSLPGCETLNSLLRSELSRLLPALPRKKDPALLRAELAEVLGIGESAPPLEASAAATSTARTRAIHPRIIFDDFIDAYRTEKVFFFSEPDVCVAGVLIHPRVGATATGTELLLLPSGTNEIVQERPRIVDILERGRKVFVFDVRGIGAVKARPITSYPDSGKHGTEFRLATDAMKMKISTLGLRVFDVLRALDYLLTRNDASPVSVSGVGIAAASALHAVALEPRFAGLTLECALLSYRAAAESPYYDEKTLDMRNIAFALLRVADVAELLAAIAPRSLTFTSPLSPAGLPLSTTEIQSGFIDPAETARLIGEQASGWRPLFANS